MPQTRRKKKPAAKRETKPRRQRKPRLQPKPTEELQPKPIEEPKPMPTETQPQPQPMPVAEVPQKPVAVTEQKEMPGKTVLKITPESSRFKYEIKKIPGAEKLMLCFQCGTCTADCPIARFDESYRPRRILRMTQLGMRDQVLKSDAIWLCAACYTCVDRCPQDVEISSVLRALRNIAVKEGYMPLSFKELASAILRTGYAYKIPEMKLKKRGETALPPLPKGNIEDIIKLFNATGFSKALEASRGS